MVNDERWTHGLCARDKTWHLGGCSEIRCFLRILRGSEAVGGVGGLGLTTGAGICHSSTPDGRCVSLLKVLLTNYCLFDCAYCINRRSSNVRRARFLVSEVVTLTIEFYKRNYIEGLFLSSGIIRSPDYTMEQMMLEHRTIN
jgi:predicted DNA-binding helix-hairpin-helix protein